MADSGGNLLLAESGVEVTVFAHKFAGADTVELSDALFLRHPVVESVYNFIGLGRSERLVGRCKFELHLRAARSRHKRSEKHNEECFHLSD